MTVIIDREERYCDKKEEGGKADGMVGRAKEEGEAEEQYRKGEERETGEIRTKERAPNGKT